MLTKRSELNHIFDEEKAELEFLYEKEIIIRPEVCSLCNAVLKRITETRFKCTKWTCRTHVSSLKNSILQNSLLPANKLLEFFYYFLSKCSFTTIQLITGHSSRTISNLLLRTQNIIARNITEMDTQIGGPGIVVQLDESKFGTRKYNRGHSVEGVWLFGGVEETESRKFFAVNVLKRDSETLTQLILKHVLPGSIIVTDGWKGYNEIKKNQNFIHHTVNNSIQLVNTTGFHSNTIEGTWSGLKATVPFRMRVLQKIQFKVFEFIWRRKNENNNLWEAFMDILKNN